MLESWQSSASLGTLEALYDAYHAQAMGLAYRLVGNQGDAEEVVQEAFLSAWRTASSYDPAKGSTRTWVLTLVRNQAIDVLRQRGRRPSQSLDASGLDPKDEADVATRAALSVDAATALTALARLPAEQRQAIEMAYFDGLSHSEIAQLIGSPVGTIKGRIRLGLDRLRTALGSLDEQRATA